MFGNRIEDGFVNHVSAAGSGAPGPWRLLLVIALGLVGFAAWAYTYEIEESASAAGRVIPSRQLQVVQSLEGGIVRAIAVQEGDLVAPGDVLLEIDDTLFRSELGRLSEQEGALRAEAARLEAEAVLARTMEVPEDLRARSPLATRAEEQLFLSQREQLSRELEVLSDQLVQRRAELAELRARRDKTRDVLAPLTEEIAQTQALVERGVVPAVELLRLRGRHAELTGELSVSAASEPRLAAAITEVERQIDATRSAYVLTARQRLARLQVELAVVQENLRAARDRVTRATLRAPVRGTVNTLHVTTIGAVTQPGAPLVEIVPAGDTLLIEADLSPRDVAFVQVGDPASVKISAYDYLVYGALQGRVERVGADTLETRERGEVFRVVISTDRAYLGSQAQPLPITPGMVATVDIQTGRKTVLSYLAKPILRARSEALRER
ncbi:membrane fusion protein, adhesin transport system [Cribrihabitans marinus]|uniref:Membrane fusion protein (MFP) family protein n=1 Tax=Cribrihabitans marinus TaxID=1227549 RepID=A0A1H7AW32_9RHOB|nr:HlyD family type I secretion periplasmic adaptor subunit [Cribrihabitans marinus]GGH32490.1 HlyD family type I secretion periplasmic adaptor subunit [Cribrihabitans marinus]SEJ68834.1 membrane fusion protein, adhesin transport system [Cribrihabitans marinus]